MFLGLIIRLTYLLIIKKTSLRTSIIRILVGITVVIIKSSQRNFELYGIVWFDFLSVVIVWLTIYIGFLRLIETCKSARRRQIKTIVVLLCLVLLGCFILTNLFLFFFFFERVLIPVLLLILMWGYQPERLQAGTYIVLYTSLGSFPFLFGISTIVSSGSSDIMQSLSSFFSRELCLVYWFYMLGFLIKLPIFPFHLWLPKAHVEAPVIGSIILAGILLKLGGYGMLRYIMLIRVNSCSFSYSLLLRVALVGGFLTRVICLRQVDLKSLIAYSSVGHMRLVIIGVLRNKNIGCYGAVLIILGHGLCSSGLFLLVNLFYKQRGSRSIIFNKGGLSLFPSLALFCLLFRAANIAVPPSLNFYGEVILYVTASSISTWFVAVVGLIRFMSGCYSLFFYRVCCHGKSSEIRGCVVAFSDLLNLLFHWLPLNFLLLFL